jgi:diaminopimelate decarboxylase
VRSELFCINVESWGELDRIEDRARAYNKVQNISIRVNPDVNLEGIIRIVVNYLIYN